ncbi:MAG: hypothetical protein EOO38_24840 [Cytophagaceae bacterium]|nr:MAG: hypothetical protein EOO38_24840 [Cytophagaceae bacterium]
MPRLQLVPAPEDEPKITDRSVALIKARLALEEFLQAGDEDGRTPGSLAAYLIAVDLRLTQCQQMLVTQGNPALVLLKGGIT